MGQVSPEFLRISETQSKTSEGFSIRRIIDQNCDATISKICSGYGTEFLLPAWYNTQYILIKNHNWLTCIPELKLDFLITGSRECFKWEVYSYSFFDLVVKLSCIPSRSNCTLSHSEGKMLANMDFLVQGYSYPDSPARTALRTTTCSSMYASPSLLHWMQTTVCLLLEKMKQLLVLFKEASNKEGRLSLPSLPDEFDDNDKGPSYYLTKKWTFVFVQVNESWGWQLCVVDRGYATILRVQLSPFSSSSSSEGSSPCHALDFPPRWCCLPKSRAAPVHSLTDPSHYK